MPNDKGWYTKEEVIETGLPYYIPTTQRWTDERYGFSVLLTKSRCKEFGVPILQNGQEKPSAFRYAAAKHQYFPLYDRTDVFVAGELKLDILYPHEIMGKLTAGGM